MMKFYQIALFLFVLNLSVMLMGQTPLFGSAFSGDAFTTNMTMENFTYTFNSSTHAYEIAYDEELIEAANFSGYQPTGYDEFGMLEILIMFANAVWNSTVYLPFFLQSVLSGILPEPYLTAVIMFITAPVWFVYGAGIFQIVWRFAFED